MKLIKILIIMIPTYDCHNKNYFQVVDELENWILTNQFSTPLHIITGNSNNMRELALQEILKLKFNYQIPIYNPGMIIIL
jgi:hypothetical protein